MLTANYLKSLGAHSNVQRENRDSPTSCTAKHNPPKAPSTRVCAVSCLEAKHCCPSQSSIGAEVAASVTIIIRVICLHAQALATGLRLAACFFPTYGPGIYGVDSALRRELVQYMGKGGLPAHNSSSCTGFATNQRSLGGKDHCNSHAHLRMSSRTTEVVCAIGRCQFAYIQSSS